MTTQVEAAQKVVVFRNHWDLRSGADYSNDAAEKVKAEIEVLANDLGRKPEALDVLEVARSQQSAMHSYFDWSDTEAATKWRKHQATALLNAIRIEVRIGETKVYPPFCPSVQVSDNVRGSHRRRVFVDSMTQDESELLQTQAASDLRAYVRKYHGVLVTLGLEQKGVALLEEIERAIRKAE